MSLQFISSTLDHKNVGTHSYISVPLSRNPLPEKTLPDISINFKMGHKRGLMESTALSNSSLLLLF